MFCLLLLGWSCCRFVLRSSGRPDIMAMLRGLISNPWGCAVDEAPWQHYGSSSPGSLTDLLSTGMLDKLTADDVLELLEYCVAR